MRYDRDGQTAPGLHALVFDPENASRITIAEALRDRSLDVLEAITEQQAIETVRARHVDVVVARTGATDSDEAAWLHAVLRKTDGPLVIPLLADATHDGSAGWLAEGAADWLTPPVDPVRVAGLAVRARRRSLETSDAIALLGSSPTAGVLRTRVLRLADSDESVWVAAEHDLDAMAVVRTIHDLSPRRATDLHVLHCASGPNDGDTISRVVAEALFEATGSSLLLAGVTELPLDAQQRLLVALGRDRAEVRLFATSNAPLREALDRGRLHEGLAELVGGSSLALPPLSERREDLSEWVRGIVAELRRLNRLPPLRVSRPFLEAIAAQRWSGGIGELRNTVEQALVLTDGESLELEHLPEPLRPTVPASDGILAVGDTERSFRDAKRSLVQRFEAAYLTQLLTRHAGNVTSAARQAGMLRSALQRLLRKHGLRSSDYRGTREVRRPPSSRPPSTLGPTER